MKTLSIGDIHGTDYWKKIEDVSKLLNKGYTPKFDKYIFVGDYVDSFDRTNNEIFLNLKQIIKLKKNYPDHIVLLIGNHDLQYIFNDPFHRCSGFRPEAYFDLHELFKRNINLFQVSFQVDNTIWSHAGICDRWYTKRMKRAISELNSNLSVLSISEQLQAMFEHNMPELFDVGRIRGGWEYQGGIFWADRRELKNDLLVGYNQIVGHTRTDCIQEFESNGDKIVFIDTMEDTKDIKEMYYILEI